MRRRLESPRDPLAERAVEVALAIAGRPRNLGERERIRLGPWPLDSEQALGPRRRRVARYDGVQRAVDGDTRSEAGERPELLPARPPPLGITDEEVPNVRIIG